MKENILSDLGRDGEAVLTSALSKYAHQFGNIAANLVTSYQNVDFDNIPDKRRGKSLTYFFPTAYHHSLPGKSSIPIHYPDLITGENYVLQ
jgi:hypothetical protein